MLFQICRWTSWGIGKLAAYYVKGDKSQGTVSDAGAGLQRPDIPLPLGFL